MLRSTTRHTPDALRTRGQERSTTRESRNGPSTPWAAASRALVAVIGNAVGSVKLEFDARVLSDDGCRADLDFFTSLCERTRAFFAHAAFARNLNYHGGNLSYGPGSRSVPGLGVDPLCWTPDPGRCPREGGLDRRVRDGTGRRGRRTVAHSRGGVRRGPVCGNQGILLHRAACANAHADLFERFLGLVTAAALDGPSKPPRG